MSITDQYFAGTMLKGVASGGLMPLREVYYSAWDAGTYHTCINCSTGLRIPPDYMRQTYFVPNYSRKCDECEQLEQEHQALFGIPDLTSSGSADEAEILQELPGIAD
jgi:hypothetical protein